MSVACTSCGHSVPLGQFRCGKCGAVQTRDSIEDLEAPDEPGSGPSGRLADHRRDASRGSAREEPTERTKRDSVVPRGTFASDEPSAPDAEAEEHADRGTGPKTAPAQGVAGETAAAGAGRGRPEAVTPAQPPHEPSAPSAAMRPPFLASEILREDLMPAEPGRSAMTRTLRIFGGLSLLLSAWSYGTGPFALASVGGLAMLAASALRVSHMTRAIMVASIAGGGLTVSAFWQVALGGHFEDALLAVSVPLLASALLFRAWYRSSGPARALVTAGLLACLAWALMSANENLLSLDWGWQSWLPPLLWCVLLILCVLSLLAFMDDETTGACDLWAVSILGWYLVNALALEALRPDNAETSPSLGALRLTAPVFAGPLAVAGAQLLARALGRPPRRVGARLVNSGT